MPADTPVDDAGEEIDDAPWHFKLLLVAFVIYLGWRAVQLIIWAAERIF